MPQKVMLLPIFMVLFLAGCIFNTTPSFPTIASFTPTDTPTKSSFPLATAVVESTLTSTLENTDSVPVIIKKIEPDKEYIFYTPFKSEQNELWGIDPTNGESTLFAEGLTFGGWSPIGNKWILLGRHALYISDPDLSNLHKIYENQKYNIFYTWWLSDDVILINAYNDLYDSPEFYILDLTTGDVNDITLKDEPRILLGSIPNKKDLASRNFEKARNK